MNQFYLLTADIKREPIRFQTFGQQGQLRLTVDGTDGIGLILFRLNTDTKLFTAVTGNRQLFFLKKTVGSDSFLVEYLIIRIFQPDIEKTVII